MFDILARVNERLPNASISLITNGSPITEAKLDGLARVKRLSYINVSLNFVEPSEYERVMKLPLVHTLQRMRLLERAVASGRISCRVRVTRVSQGASSDRHFRQWVRDNFPWFRPEILPHNDWIGQVEAFHPDSPIPNVACHRWFDLSISATGTVAMCCMDGEAKYPKGDVRQQHALDIYNQPFCARSGRHLRAAAMRVARAIVAPI